MAGGSGDTSGITAADTGASTQENLRGPDVVATQGEQEELDPERPGRRGQRRDLYRLLRWPLRQEQSPGSPRF